MTEDQLGCLFCAVLAFLFAVSALKGGITGEYSVINYVEWIPGGSVVHIIVGIVFLGLAIFLIFKALKEGGSFHN